MRIGIIAALPGELKPLVHGWEKMPVVKASGVEMWETERNGHELVAACAGMGMPAARRAFSAAEFAGAMDLVISVGWAGALSEAGVAGECYRVREVVDTQTGERFAFGDLGQRLVTTAHVADAEEKHRLAMSYDAALVDMEAAAIARLAQMRGIPMQCFKGVSDGVGAELPDLNPFIDLNGKMKMASFLAYVALRPGYWGSLARLGTNSAAAAKALAREVDVFVGAIERGA